ncbi:MAG: hypothetical protein Q9170_001290 [Blastenia crenularia]
MQAIARSGVPVVSMRIYSDSRRCSVPTWDVNELMPALESAGFTQAARSIKSISLSVSTKVKTDWQEIWGAVDDLSEVDRAYHNARLRPQARLLSQDDPTAVAEGNYPGIARLLKQMLNLERLELHLYNTLSGVAESYAKVFTYIADELILTSLKHCTLRGLYSDEESLLKFLRAHEGLVELKLCNMHLVSGSWTPVFAQLCAMESIQWIILSDIWASGIGLIHLAPKGTSSSSWSSDGTNSYPCVRGTIVHTRAISRAEILDNGLDFARRPSGRQLGSPAFQRYFKARQVEYGPP